MPQPHHPAERSRKQDLMRRFERRFERRSSGRREGHVQVLLGLALALVLTSCGGTVETPGEPLRMLREALPEAFLGEPYQATLRVVGGLRPFTFELSEGELPPGVDLASGALVGVPSELGTYSFTVTVSDASLNTTFEEYTLRVAEVPPPSIAYNVPGTEVQRPVTLRAVVTGRDLRALRTAASWDPERFELVEGSFTHAADLAALTEATPGRLQVDLAALGEAIEGDRQVFSFALAPIETAPRLTLRTETEFLAAGRHFWTEANEGAPPDSPVLGPNDGVDEDGLDDDPFNDDGLEDDAMDDDDGSDGSSGGEPNDEEEL